ncbi:hypothetical protein PHLGIDRAFT_37466 [Phlebiopsis gigantea 11061_1 CR5-6]|uniref:BRCT domain-containing protein n=1 Tax=Phlebiopsis gigantea (strain 11061_1 CR5-6) TaxID=745531 RepID=A0A0C3RSK4_PHLG1|nr:hypothetical protein PHLGIDRAFT_37466 [Phlebiopsis gigantea 11061_1 CR5-6]
MNHEQIFESKDGEPIQFHLVSGPTYVTKKRGLDDASVEHLTGVIEAHGGEVVEGFDAAAVWVVNHRAVSENFVDDCVKKGMYIEEPLPEKIIMPGRYPGKANLFTKKDEKLLCTWIATKVPEQGSGGRLGTAIWKTLGRAHVEFPDGMWAGVSRHPVSSWKQHYKMNQERLDPIIDEVAGHKNLTAHSRTAYNADRRANRGRMKGKKRQAKTVEVQEDREQEVGSDAEVEDGLLAEFENDTDPVDELGKEFSDPSSVESEELYQPAAAARNPRRSNMRPRQQVFVLVPARRDTRQRRPGPEDAGPSGVRQRSASVARRAPARPSETAASLDFSQKTLVNPSPSKIVQAYSKKRGSYAIEPPSPVGISPLSQSLPRAEAKRRRIENDRTDQSSEESDNPFAS